MYQLTRVTRSYNNGRRRVPALRDVNLSIGYGEWLAIQGRTGHGKTTLLQLLGGLDRPSTGTLKLEGRDLAQLGEADLTALRANTIGFVFQTFNLVPTLTAAENVEAALIPLSASPAERRRRVTAALEAVDLDDRAAHLPSQLSGGQQQRVAIARAVVKEPKVLLADEPTGNLDEDTRDEIISLLEELWRDRGLTLVMVTHDSSVARRAQRVAIMSNGHLSIRQETVRSAGRGRSDPGPKPTSERSVPTRRPRAR
jgi:putative ABC transport system ATP-binding protein